MYKIVLVGEDGSRRVPWPMVYTDTDEARKDIDTIGMIYPKSDDEEFQIEKIPDFDEFDKLLIL